MKRIFALLLVVVMCLALGVSAFAIGETDGSIIITGVQFSDQVFEAYQIFAGDVSGDVNGEDAAMSNIVWGANVGVDKDGYGLSDAGHEGQTIYQALAAISTTFQDEEGDPLASAAQVAAALGNAVTGEAEKFADVISDFLTEDPIGVSSTTDGSGIDYGAKPYEDTDGKTYYEYTINVGEYGYYLVDNRSVGSDEAYTAYLLKVVGPKTEIAVKEEVPELTKTISELKDKNGTIYFVDSEGNGKVSEVSIGDEITYQLDITVPDVSDYSYYYFIVTDTLAKGLDFNNDAAITINGTRLVYADGFDAAGPDSEGHYTYRPYTWALDSDGDPTETKDYLYKDGTETPIENWFTVVTDGTSGSENGTTITIAVHDFLQYNQAGGNTVTITYSAVLTKDAVLGVNYNDNEAYLTYSDDPNYHYDGWSSDTDGTTIPDEETPTGTTPHDKTYTYSAGIEIDKVDGDTKAWSEALAGAEFTLTGEAMNVVVTTGEVYVENESDEGKYYGLWEDARHTGEMTYTTEAPASFAGADNYQQILALYEGYDPAQGENSNFTTYDLEKYEDYEIDSSETTVTAVVDPETGKVIFKGLAAGRYTITETKTPDGYNTIEPIEVEIVFTPGNSADAEPTWTIYINGSMMTEEGSGNAVTPNGDGVFVLTVENNRGTKLPGTGGIGTTLFTVAGVVIVCSAAVLLVTKRRVGKDTKETE